ncbi:MAG: head decoration protein [Propionibacteriaceae bacterium]|jgi:hypothetical protein|nr:head decoration protein [Propionibacteriaceae bacterium]
MADFSVTRKVTPGNGDYRWLRSSHADGHTIAVAVLRSLLKPGIHYDTNGIIPAGLPLGKLTGQAEYGPYDPNATDGRQYLAGFVLDPEQLHADFSGVTTTVVQVSMMVEGIIDPAYVPTKPILTNQTPTTGQFVFVGVDYAAPATA